MIHSLILPPRIFLQIVFYIFRTFKYMCAKYFLQIHLFAEMITELVIYYANIKNIQYSIRSLQQYDTVKRG